jgi:hypothetical protein
MSDNKKSIEYYAGVLFVQAVAEDGVLSEEEATAVEEALAGFLEGLESEAEPADVLDLIASEVTGNIEGYKKSLKEAIEFVASQDEKFRLSIFDLMKDLATSDDLSIEEMKFFKALKPVWGI